MEVRARHSIVDRMIGAATLDIPTYEDVEHDEGATGQAAIVVLLVAIASAIGSIGNEGRSIIGVAVFAFVSWLIWAGLTYLIGDKIFGGTATWGELLRTLGFAQAPGVLLILAIIPLLGALVSFIVWIWMLVTGVVAIRQALDFSTGKAIGTAVIAWVVLVLIGMLVPFLRP
jgi:hypothetical protein